MQAKVSRIVFASGNAGKVREIGQLLEGLSLDVLPQSDFNVPEIEETGCTFVENAILKARNAAHHTGLAVIADDSGIVVDVLQGRPGIVSARFAGVGASDEDNLNKLIEMIKPFPEEQRTARFICSMVYLRHEYDPVPIIAQGVWEGQLITDPKGSNGFGYDPMFYVSSQQCTSAELTPEIKNKLSHRGQALTHLLGKLNEVYSVE
ncbi:MAG: RdgB/HAM1 family non-canonical purine NTP pyrophosphatase [Proteobacteria bacterium]|nr:RdgB/HAM1 family non-canonical purine NTP pyrophosphatase [Pseudomonadota bacterium]MCH8261631.1 RdgB/HAM1 family non-canonical purine NTP pyrophosphatase [Pseudomonadota bacterium]